MQGPENIGIDKADFLTAWEKVEREIKFSFEAKEDQAESRPLATKQVRYVLALMSFAFFLDHIGQEEIGEHFQFLAEAMNDLVDGISHPLFKVEAEAKPGRQPDTSTVWRLRADICTGINLLVAGGMSEDDAIQWIVKNHKSEFAKLLRPNADLESSIRTWRKSFANDEIRNEIALLKYKEGLKLLPYVQQNFSGANTSDAAKIMISRTASRVSSFII